jgi:hypothetical protein
MIGRVAAITGLLGVLGGVAGALGGALIMTALTMFEGGPYFSFLELLGIAGGVGFTFGVVAGPTLGWTLLRRVPLWRAVGETAAAAGVAVTVALALGASMTATFVWPAAAALAAALRLRWSHSNAPLLPRETSNQG